MLSRFELVSIELLRLLRMIDPNNAHESRLQPVNQATDRTSEKSKRRPRATTNWHVNWTLTAARYTPQAIKTIFYYYCRHYPMCYYNCEWSSNKQITR